ncbi:Uncharacterized protein SCF082_LOCUS33148 [Durusdinium trenchii]|uniref:Uncharacterized protein n=1 Tax=Durusdinium trenchii TaxID=1381693 RepID=A0ABP0NKR0_9DINO
MCPLRQLQQRGPCVAAVETWKLGTYKPCSDLSVRLELESWDGLGKLPGKLLGSFALTAVRTSKKALDHILSRLDSAFRCDSKVELPADFSAYFEHLQRKQGQALLQFVTDHDDKLKQIEKHGAQLPDAVQGWHLLAKAGLTHEQSR